MAIDDIRKNRKKPLENVLETATATLSSCDSVTFTLYVRTVLPLDGFVFWVKASILSAHQREVALREDSNLPDQVKVKGSYHQREISRQSDSENVDESHVTFTANEKCDVLGVKYPSAMYIGERDGVRFSFSHTLDHYQQSGIWHYRGMAILPTMFSQIVDDARDLPANRIVSSSLPFWLSVDRYAPVFPAKLVPQNLTTPYIAVACGKPKPWQFAPEYIDGQRYQLVTETVTVFLQQFDNEQALNYMDHVVRYALETELIGVSNSPVVEDARNSQVETRTIDQAKVITFEVNYYQQSVSDLARRLILEATIDIIPKDTPTIRQPQT